MMNWFTGTVIAFALVLATVFGYLMVNQQNNNTRAAAEISGTLETALLGDSRIIDASGNLGTRSGDKGDGGISRKELVAEIIAEVVNTAKNHRKDVEVEYVFLDKDDNPTNNDKKVESVQYKISIYGKEDGFNDGKVESAATKRVAINVLPR